MIYKTVIASPCCFCRVSIVTFIVATNRTYTVVQYCKHLHKIKSANIDITNSFCVAKQLHLFFYGFCGLMVILILLWYYGLWYFLFLKSFLWFMVPVLLFMVFVVYGTSYFLWCLWFMVLLILWFLWFILITTIVVFLVQFDIRSLQKK